MILGATGKLSRTCFEGLKTDLMYMRSADLARVDKRIKAFDCELGAAKAHHVSLLGGDGAGKGQRSEKVRSHREH